MFTLFFKWFFHLLLWPLIILSEILFELNNDGPQDESVYSKTPWLVVGIFYFLLIFITSAFRIEFLMTESRYVFVWVISSLLYLFFGLTYSFFERNNSNQVIPCVLSKSGRSVQNEGK